MDRMRMLRIAAALTLTLTFPLGAGAIPDTKRERPDTALLAHDGVRGVDLAVQVASGRAQGLRHEGGPPGSEFQEQAPAASFHPSAPDRDHEGSAPVPEPSSILLFAVSLLLARSAIRRSA
jgi:hypothetical protein